MVNGKEYQLDFHPITLSDGTKGYSGVLFIEPALTFTIENENHGAIFKPANTNPLIKEAVLNAIGEREREDKEDFC